MKRSFAVLFALLCIMIFSGCNIGGLGLAGERTNEETVSFEAARPGEYDSADTVIVAQISKANECITFYNFELQKYYTLSFDSITKYSDKYDSAMSVDQLHEGMMADITFLKSKKLLVNLKESSKAVVLDNVTGFSIDGAERTLSYKSESFKISGATIVINGSNSLNELKEEDVITLVSLDNDIVCIIVDKGHGYLKLKCDDFFLDGVIEAGLFNASKISSDTKMILTEGEYDITISKSKTEVSRKVTIERDKETILDITGIEIEEAKIGKVIFEVSPETAEVYIDGVKIDNNKLYEYGYGMHRLFASAKGYDSITRYFKVENEQTSISVKLEAQEEEEEKEEDKTEGYYIVIMSPSGAEVSFDGNYVGMIGTTPLSIKKVAGNHSITLRKNGCITRSYSVLIENAPDNIYYSFEELEEEVKETTPKDESSVSGNE